MVYSGEHEQYSWGPKIGHAQNRTLPDLLSICPWNIWLRDYISGWCLFVSFFVLLAEQGAEVEGTLQPHSSELYIPKHAACHNDLAPYSELMKWVKEVDQAVFLELCQVSRDCSVSFLHTTGTCAKPPTTACPLLSSQKLKICFWDYWKGSTRVVFFAYDNSRKESEREGERFLEWKEIYVQNLDEFWGKK